MITFPISVLLTLWFYNCIYLAIWVNDIDILTRQKSITLSVTDQKEHIDNRDNSDIMMSQIANYVDGLV